MAAKASKKGKIAAQSSDKRRPKEHSPVPPDRDVTLQEQMEDVRQRSEQSFRTLAEHAPDIIARFDGNLRHLYVNPSIEPVTGIPPHRFIGKTNEEMGMPEELCERWNRAVQRVFKTNRPETVVFDFEAVNGTRSFEMRAVPELEADGRIESVMCITRDITERKQAEETLRQSQADLNRAQAVARTGSWRLEVRRNELLWSDETHRIFGIPKGTPMTYETFLGTVHPDDGEYVDQQWQAALHGEPYDIEHRIVVDGQVKWVRERAELEFDKEGVLLGGFGTAQDITERKRMEEALRKSRDELETRVQERTAELRSVVEAFQDEMAERKRAEEAVKAERQRFHDVLETLPAYLVLLTPDYHVPFANRFFRERFGESQGLRCFEYLFGRSEPCEVCETYTVLKTMAPHEWEWIGPDGRTYDVFDFPFPDTDGSTLILEMGIDITERKRAEEALKARSLYARSLIEASLDPLVTISPEGKVTDVNKATELITGFSRDQLIGSDFSNYFIEPEKARDGCKQAFDKEFVRDYPLAIRDTSGHITEVLYNATLYRNEAGEVQGVFAAARDITAQRLAEQERLRLIAAIEQSGESILITDNAGMIRYVNPSFEHINGYMPQEVLGKSYFDILKGGVRDEGFEKAIEDTLSSGQIWKGHITRKKKDGTSYDLDVTISPVRGQSGNIISHSVIERDVTHEAILEQHLRQQQKMEALGTLAGGIAHDFNNILMPIMINTELSLYDIPRTNPVNQYLNTVLEAAQRGQELVKQIITFSRQKEQERKPIKLPPAIKEALKFLRATVSQNIEIRENVDVEAGMILGDPTQIHQVLMNLCSNAAYAMREKGGMLEVGLTNVEVDAHMLAKHLALKPGPYLKLTVSDTGHGMGQDVMKRIFDPFFTTKKPGEGTGMGLAVVHGIVKRHEGAIITYSEVGKGSTFNIFFPRIVADLESEAVDLGAIPMGKERILFVDDEEVQVRSGQRLLERLGYQVITATDGHEALKVFRSKPDAFDLVITDQSMPRLTGIRLAEKLMRIRPDIPVILCTGFSEGVDGKKARAMGIREFMMKPFSVRQLAETIRRVLDARN